MTAWTVPAGGAALALPGRPRWDDVACHHLIGAGLLECAAGQP